MPDVNGDSSSIHRANQQAWWPELIGAVWVLTVFAAFVRQILGVLGF